MQPALKKTLIPELSQDTKTLADCLRATPVGAVVSYQTLTQLIQRNVQREGRHLLTSARKIVKREDLIVFGVVRGEGLKRLTDHEVANTGTAVLHHINRASSRGVQTLACVHDFTSLTLEEQVRHNTAMSLLGVFYEVSRAKGVRRIENAVSIMQKQLPFTDTLKAFLLAS